MRGRGGVTDFPSSPAGAGSASVEEGELYLAIRDHVATGDELMFLRGEQILVIQKLSEREWVVRLTAATTQQRLWRSPILRCAL